MSEIKVVSTVRQISTTLSHFNEPEPNNFSIVDADTNNDTFCLGVNFEVIEPTSRVADVYAHNKEAQPIEHFPIISY